MRKEIVGGLISLAIVALMLCVIWATPTCGCDCDVPFATEATLVFMLCASGFGVSAAVRQLIDWIQK